MKNYEPRRRGEVNRCGEMKTSRETEGYDVPWEFVKRRVAAAPTGTATLDSVCSTTRAVTGTASKGTNDENGIGSRATLEPIDIDSRKAESSSVGDDHLVGERKNHERNNRASKKPPIVAPKPCTGSDPGRLAETSPNCVPKMRGDSVNISTPPCGVRAQRIRKGRFTSNGTAIGTVSGSVSPKETPAGNPDRADFVVWEYRKPEHDARPSCEYDAPWDCKQRRSCNGDTLSCLCPAADAGNVNGEGVYDEPWDIRNSGHVKKVVQSFVSRSTKRESVDKNEHPGAMSPSSSQSSDRAAGVVLSSHERNGRRGDRLSDIISSNSLLSGNGAAKGNCDKSASNPRSSLRLETAFCGKPAGGSKKMLDKDKLIQQLHSGGDVGPAAQQNDRKSAKGNTQSYEGLENDQRGNLEEQMVDSKGAVSEAAGDGENGRGVEMAVDSVGQLPLPDYDTPWEFITSPKTAVVVKKLHNLQRQPQQKPQELQAGTTNKAESKSKMCRQHLSLNFGCIALNTSAKIDTMLSLTEQLWYHGNVTRAEAEQRLSKAAEGSFLVRVCESSSRQCEEYALSLKSAKGFMHMKIQQDPQRNWILGYFSQPFESIPIMIRYYSVNKLPIKGAEHMRLVRPVADQVL